MLILQGKGPINELLTERRYRLLTIESDFFIRLIKSDGYKFEIISTLPKDTKIINARFDDTRMRFDLILYSESFDKVPEGGLIPEETSMVLFHTIPNEQIKEKDEA